MTIADAQSAEYLERGEWSSGNSRQSSGVFMKNSKLVRACHVGSMLALGLWLSGCGDDDENPPATGNTASAEIQGLGTNTGIGGVLTFTEVASGVSITGSVTGLAPNSTHGMHIHEVGDCSSADGMSAGGHWNPGAQMHGAPGSAAAHLGDLGNLVADAAGNATLSLTQAGAKMDDGSAFDVINRSVIVHASADDLMTDPSGNSGARIACGEIF
jgi:Cu-Zn family superoxide dismutase